MRLSTLFSLIIFLLTSVASAEVTVSYTVEPNIEHMYVSVRASVTGLEPGSLPEVQISEQFGSATDYYKDVEALAIVQPDQNAFESIAPHRWRLRQPLTGERLEYTYRIRVHQQFPNERIRFKPSLSNKAYYSLGYPLFIFPSLDIVKAEKFYVNFRVPQGWQEVTSLYKQPRHWSANGIDELLASTIALGNYRSYEFTLPNGTPFTMALNGAWSFADASLADMAFKTISGQIEMMQSWHFPRYTVVMSQSTEKGSSGSGLVNAFEMFAHPTTKLEDLVYLISHENFHYWNGNRIRYGAPKDRWFSEGFTEYYTYVTVGRMEISTLAQTLAAMSKTVLSYFENPIAQAINFEEAGKYFWEWLPEYGHLFYSKGMLLALMTDVRLRSASSNQLSLDGFMRHLDQKYFGSERTIDDQLIARELQDYSKSDWQEFIERFVKGSEELPINDYTKLAGMEITRHACNRADLGMVMMPYFCSPGQPCGYKATNVSSSGPAHRAGIREGDVIAQWTPPYVQRQPAHTPVKFGIKQADGALIWYEYVSEEKEFACQSLSFMDQPDPVAEKIRDAIWKRSQ